MSGGEHRWFERGLYRLWVRLDGDISFVLRRGGGRRLLDVGCNEGRNLRLYRQSGFLAEGVETNRVAASVARGYGFTVYSQELADIDSGAGYDVIVLSNVLEHVDDPSGMLANVRRLLRPSGEVWISCPNARSFAHGWFGSSWINWHPPFHLAHYSPEDIRRLVAGSGFDVCNVSTVTPALWVAQSYLARRWAKYGRPTLQMRNPIRMTLLLIIVRGALFPVLWERNRHLHGDCILVTARKSEFVYGS